MAGYALYAPNNIEKYQHIQQRMEVFILYIYIQNRTQLTKFKNIMEMLASKELGLNLKD